MGFTSEQENLHLTLDNISNLYVEVTDGRVEEDNVLQITFDTIQNMQAKIKSDGILDGTTLDMRLGAITKNGKSSLYVEENSVSTNNPNTYQFISTKFTIPNLISFGKNWVIQEEILNAYLYPDYGSANNYYAGSEAMIYSDIDNAVNIATIFPLTDEIAFNFATSVEMTGIYTAESQSIFGANAAWLTDNFGLSLAWNKKRLPTATPGAFSTISNAALTGYLAISEDRSISAGLGLNDYLNNSSAGNLRKGISNYILSYTQPLFDDGELTLSFSSNNDIGLTNKDDNAQRSNYYELLWNNCLSDNINQTVAIYVKEQKDTNNETGINYKLSFKF